MEAAADPEKPPPEELPEAAVFGDRLVNKELQDSALGLWFLVLFAVLYALHAPVSCAQHTEEQAKTPSRCRLIGDAEPLRLPDYCWWPCAAYLRTWLLLSVSFAMVMQAAVVILNHQGCSTCLRLRWHFDLSDMLGIADRDGKAESILFKVLHPIQAVRDMGIKRFIHQASKDLNVGSLVSKVSLVCVGNAMMQTAFFFAYSLSTFGSFFECTDKDGFVHEVASIRSNETELVAAGVALFLQLNIFGLVRKAQWTKQVKVHVQSEDVLLRQFKAVEQGDGLLPRYFPLENPPDEYYHCLKRAFLMELVSVEDDGLNVHPHDLGSVSGWVTLHFKSPAKKESLETYHRKRAIAALFLGVILMFFASQSCWTCVKGIHAHPGLTAYELDKLLLLMGACGRHHSVGFPCWLASIALAIACLQQLVVMAASKVQERSSRTGVVSQESQEEDNESCKVDVDHQLTANIVDMRRTLVLDPQRYRDAGAAMPTVPCHVWVMASAKEETPMDCSALDSEDQRKRWTRSKRPRPVQIAEEPDMETKQSWIRGLVRTEYNPPVQCIEFALGDLVGSTTVKQIVPPEFIAGHFHAWVVLGPREAWEKFSIGLTCGAVALAVFDMLMFFLIPNGNILSNCHEVLTGQCISFSVRPNDPDAPIVFRTSVGVWAACAGGLSALFGAVGLRVCMNVRSQRDNATASCCSLYSAALCNGMLKLFPLLVASLCGFFSFLAKWCCRRFCSDRPAFKRGYAVARLE